MRCMSQYFYTFGILLMWTFVGYMIYIMHDGDLDLILSYTLNAVQLKCMQGTGCKSCFFVQIYFLEDQWAVCVYVAVESVHL